MAKKKKKNDGKKGSAETKAPAGKSPAADPPKPAEDDKDVDDDEAGDEDEADDARSAEVSGPRPSASKGNGDDEDEDHDHDDEDEDEDEDEPRRAPAKQAHAAHAAHGAHHGAHGAHHHKPDRKGYVRIWVYLFALTILEVGVAYLVDSVGKTAVVTALVGLALAKATCVALYYMHLSHESKFMRYTVAFPMVFPALYAFILIAEGAYRALWGGS
jgi:caa(3)-type oxidase subunit IV